MNIGEFGELGQLQSDGTIEMGDSANWTGHHIYLTDVDFPYVEFYEKHCGGYVRHPFPETTKNGFGSFYDNPWAGCISRDQLTGIIAALISLKEYKAMLRLIFNHSLRGFLFAYNTIHNGADPRTAGWKFPDLTLLDIWAHELRGLGWISWLFYPVLMIFDLQMLASTIVNNNRFRLDPISYAIKLIVSKEHVPTVISLLSWKLCDKKKLIEDIDRYWSGWRAQPFMVELYSARLQ